MAPVPKRGTNFRFKILDFKLCVTFDKYPDDPDCGETACKVLNFRRILSYVISALAYAVVQSKKDIPRYHSNGFAYYKTFSLKTLDFVLFT